VGGVKGASIHVAEVCKALTELGASVTLLAQRLTGSVPDGVELVLLDPGPLPRGPDGEPARMAACDEFARRAAPVLARLRPDLVYERLSLFFGSGRELARNCGAARLVEVNAPVTAERERHFGLALRAAGELAEREALAGARALVVSEPLVAFARQRGVAQVEVVANGVDLGRFDPQRRRDEAGAVRRALRLEQAELVGFIGSLEPWHGVDVLLDAVELLAPSRPSLRLLVVGDGPCRPALEARAANPGLRGRVIFTGALLPSTVAAHLIALDVATAPYLQSDYFYFSPLKVLEAMAAGRPLVASRFGPIAAMLAGTGLLVSPGDPVDLAGAIARLLEDPAAAAQLGLAARRQAVRTGGWNLVATRILDAAAPRGAGLSGAARR